MVRRRNTIQYNFGDKHKEYIKRTNYCAYNIAEGSIRSGKTTDNVLAFSQDIKRSKDKIFLATASTQPTAKLIIGDCDGYGLEHIFRGQCRWGKYKGNECLIIKGVDTGYREKVVLFCGGAKVDSYKKFRGMTVGAWIATEIDLHHDNTIREALKRQIKADRKKIYWDLNPDNPNKFIYTDYIDDWQEKADEGVLLGGYNYQQFNIFDNPNIPPHNLEEVLSRYTVGTVNYKRDILGQRCVAEGLIYDYFANNEEEFYVTKKQLPKFRNILMGIDWGGNQSKHAFQLVGITDKWDLYALRSKTHIATGMTPDQLFNHILEFIKKGIADFGNINAIYADSADPIMINGLATKTNIRVYSCIKHEILDRIRATSILMSSKRLFILKDECKDLIGAFREAVWDETEIDDKRLDDGSYCVDILDSFEYAAFSYYLYQFTRK